MVVVVGVMELRTAVGVLQTGVGHPLHVKEMFVLMVVVVGVMELNFVVVSQTAVVQPLHVSGILVRVLVRGYSATGRWTVAVRLLRQILKRIVLTDQYR